MITETVTQNLEEIRRRLAEAAKKSGRTPEEIKLVVVSKNRTVEELEAAMNAGADQLGENRVQEADSKRGAIRKGVTFRLIGHLQRNKAGSAIDIFDAIDSLDSIRLAKQLQKELEKAQKIIPVLVQVNSSGEKSKFGFDPDELEPAIEEIEELERIKIKGIMTIGPLTDEESDIRRSFELTRRLYEKSGAGRDFEILSMGMSGDFEMAIAEGSNMIRIGTAVFARR